MRCMQIFIYAIMIGNKTYLSIDQELEESVNLAKLTFKVEGMHKIMCRHAHNSYYFIACIYRLPSSQQSECSDKEHLHSADMCLPQSP